VRWCASLLAIAGATLYHRRGRQGTRRAVPREGRTMLSVGVGAADITPPEGIVGRLGLEHTLGPAPHPCMAKALYLESGRARVIQVCCEVVGLTRGVATLVRAEIQRALGVPADLTILTATHTHCSPWLWDLQDQEARREGIELLDRAYLGALVRGCVHAAGRAMREARPRRLRLGSAPVRDVASNRVQFGFRGSICADARLRTEPEGDIDPLVRVLLVGEAGRPDAVVANYACHPSGYGGGKTPFASPDFPWHAEQALGRIYGAAVPLHYLMGCAGDINPGKHVAGGSHEEVRRLGERLAEGIVAACRRSESVDGPLVVAHVDRHVPAGGWIDDVAGARARFRAACAEVRDAREARGQGQPLDSGLVHRWRMAIKALDKALLVREGGYDARIHLVGFGPARLLFTAGEWFHAFGLELASLGPPGMVWVTTLADIDLLYMPDRGSRGARASYGVEPSMRTIGDQGVDELFEAMADLVRDGSGAEGAER
jgi:hypothetical protein